MNIEVHEPIVTASFLTSIDELEEMINDENNTEERERVFSWNIKRDSTIQIIID